MRAWLYKIATNTCLDAIARRPKRVLPIEHGPAPDPHDGVGEPLVESVWIEPYPDERLGVEDGYAAPEARYEQREGVELAFIAALQHLPANQRAVLIMREVLGFSAQETSESLETSVQSVNSALQRARKSVDEKLPEQSQQATLRALGDDGLREIVENYMDAMQRGDVDTIVSMLAEDAGVVDAPAASWFRGVDAVRVFLAKGPISGAWRWRHVAARVNGQAAVAGYIWDDEAALPPVRARRADARGRPDQGRHRLHHPDRRTCPTRTTSTAGRTRPTIPRRRACSRASASRPGSMPEPATPSRRRSRGASGSAARARR